MKKQDGAVTIIAIMILAVLTLIAVSSFNTSKVEVFVFKNEHQNNMSFYQAEIAAKRAAFELRTALTTYLEQNLTSPSRKLKWLYDESNLIDIYDQNAWLSGNASKPMTTNPDNRFIAVHRKQNNTGSSLSMTNQGSKVHEYTIYAKSTKGGEAMIEIGFTKRF